MSYLPPSAPRLRRRRSKRWFQVGGALLAPAVAIFVGGVFWTISDTRTDGTFPADGTAAAVTSPASKERMLFVTYATGQVNGPFSDNDPAEPTCTITDGSGEERELDDVSGKTTFTQGTRGWLAIATFDSGDGDLSVTCAGDGQNMRVGAPVGLGFGVGVAADLVTSLVLPLILGAIGILVLLIATILHLTNAARKTS